MTTKLKTESTEIDEQTLLMQMAGLVEPIESSQPSESTANGMGETVCKFVFSWDENWLRWAVALIPLV